MGEFESGADDVDGDEDLDDPKKKSNCCMAHSLD
jgi:hypothetical protein